MPDATDMFRLTNDVALITGGGTGLGLAMARRMAQAGARVVITGRREQVLRDAVQDIGHGACYFTNDITQTQSLEPLVARISEQVAAPTILVNNAGINMKKPTLDTSDEEFLRIMQTNVLGSFSLSRAVAPGMVQQGRGSILFIASMASLFGIPGVVAYSAAKTALLGMVRTMAVDLSAHHVRVNAIAPGWIDSAMLRKSFEGDSARRDRILARTPMAKVGDPDDIAHAAIYLSSPAASFVTGTVLPVDGGVSIGF